MLYDLLSIVTASDYNPIIQNVLGYGWMALILAVSLVFNTYFFRKEKVTGAEMCLAIACGIVTALDSNWTYFFPCPNNSPTSLCQK